MIDSADGDLERLRDLVLADLAVDRSLVGPLLAARTRAEFVALVRELAAARGLSVTDDEVLAGLTSARRSWLERWA
jgi:hypothetical protein